MCLSVVTGFAGIVATLVLAANHIIVAAFNK